MNDFWKTWLDIWCLAIIAFGGILAGAGFVGFEGRCALMFPSKPDKRAGFFNDVERFAFGLMGAITIGWGLTLFYFFRAAHASNMGNKMYRQAFAVLIIWNLIDGYILLNRLSNQHCFKSLAFFRLCYSTLFDGQIEALGTLRRFNPRLQFSMHFRR